MKKDIDWLTNWVRSLIGWQTGSGHWLADILSHVTDWLTNWVRSLIGWHIGSGHWLADKLDQVTDWLTNWVRSLIGWHIGSGHWLADKLGQVTKLIWSLIWKTVSQTHFKGHNFHHLVGTFQSIGIHQSAVSVNCITQTGWITESYIFQAVNMNQWSLGLGLSHLGWCQIDWFLLIFLLVFPHHSI